MASSRPEVGVEVAEVPVYRVCPYSTHLGPCGHYLLAERLLSKRGSAYTDRSALTPVDRGPSLQVRRARARAVRTLNQIDLRNNHDDQTTEHGPLHAIRGLRWG